MPQVFEQSLFLFRLELHLVGALDSAISVAIFVHPYRISYRIYRMAHLAIVSFFVLLGLR